jgi:hypothetical protein
MDAEISKVTENYYRRWAKRMGLFLKKSRGKRVSVDNRGGYMLVDIDTNTILHGEKFDLDLEQVENILETFEKELHKG